jgi:hypothetical protein
MLYLFHLQRYGYFFVYLDNNKNTIFAAINFRHVRHRQYDKSV